jgi:putative spermidine/putrescine transport system substrate-binding protein
MPGFRWSARVLVPLVAVSVLAAACGDDDDDAATDTQAAGATVASTEATAAAGAQAPAAAAADGAARLAVPEGVDLAAAAQQAKSFRTLGMPDDWLNFGDFFTGMCNAYALSCTGSGAGPNRQDTDASSAEEIAAFLDEKSNPAVCADIGIAFGQVAEREGAVLDYLPPAAADLPAPYRAAQGGWVATGVGVISFLVNTAVVDDPPTTWADLLDPKYKGQIMMSNPTTSGTGQATVFSAAAALGKGTFDLDAAYEYFEDLQGSGNLYQGDGSANELIERGEVGIVLRYDFVNLIAKAGFEEAGLTTIQVAIPEDGGVFAPSALMCNVNTDKPDLARLAMNYALSDEAQLSFAEFGARPVRFVTGDLDVPQDLRTNWLPDAQYAKVIEFPDNVWPDPADVAERWESEVLT